MLAFLAAALVPGAGALLLGSRPPRRAPGNALTRMLTVAIARAGRRARAPRDLPARITAAGRPAGLGAPELMTAKLAGAGIGVLPGAALAVVAPGRLGLVSLLAVPVAGFLAPDAWLARRAGQRFRRVRQELPTLLDLLRVTVEAGLPLAVAFAEVGERTEGPLGREWRAVGREVALGAPVGEALRAMSERLPLPEVAALVAALERAARHGAPLAATLSSQARDARERRRRRIQEEAARAAPKIQLVVALLLVPSVLLLVAAALAGALLDGGSVLRLV